MIAILLSVSFLTGQLWYLFCELTKSDAPPEGEEPDPTVNNENFIDCFGIDDADNNWDKMVTLTYFAFTSLSTVGFGDYHPRADGERAFGAMILLFGVAMTTYVMDTLMRVIADLRTINSDHDENVMLSLFFKILERFNLNYPVNDDFVSNMQEYFDYRWKNNNN